METITRENLPPAFRCPDAQTGPLTDGGWRWVGVSWGVDLDSRGRPTDIILWPSGLTEQQYRKGAIAACYRAMAAWSGDEDDERNYTRTW